MFEKQHKKKLFENQVDLPEYRQLKNPGRGGGGGGGGWPPPHTPMCLIKTVFAIKFYFIEQNMLSI